MRTSSKLLVSSVLIVMLLAGFAGGLYYQSQVDAVLAQDAVAAQLNHDQSLIYNATMKAQMVAPSYPANATVTNGTAYAIHVHDWTLQFFIHFFYAAYYPNGSVSHGTSANQSLVNQGFTPDCIQRCSMADGWIRNGINYFKDPTTIITNQGRGVEQCSVFHGTGITDTCTTTNVATYIGWSTKLQSGQTVNATDAWSGTHQSCSTGGGGTYLIVDANGLRDVAGTVTSAANAATVSTTISHTFSITGTYTAMGVACLLSGTGTNADSGTNPLIYGEATTGPFTWHTGDSLTGVWIVSRT